ncbi:MAG TPA: SDR family NAD(P)-dependent oxidoreductase [Anaerolineae bacterium]|jgi:NAD(P)-dependent dehydrogenase (short-subunit alcohol dehydrogenase family)|nr:SDR family NAD(P)-dependent oxidoreductase [Anaerolineae bacterium]
MQRLKGKIAVVTGASRGGGRGIALVLGEEGATVYVTGRSVRGGPTTDDLPGTVEETAEQATARGGVGIPVRCDHTVDVQVEALLERVEREQGRLDVLVNNVWGGYEGKGSENVLGNWSFWEEPVWVWDKMFQAGVRAHYAASRLAARLMVPRRQGLIVSTTFRDPRGKYLGDVPYDVSKAAINRMAYGIGLHLRAYNVAVVALSPGWMRTEAVMSNKPPHGRPLPGEVEQTESVEYVGRAVAALAADPNVMQKSGRTLTVGELAQEYGFTDVDGRYVPPFRIPEESLMD